MPDLSLPTTVFSNIDSKVGEGGVIRYSADNLTLYNLGLAVRLYGGLLPSDDFLDTGHSSSIHTSSLWGVEVNSGAAWVPLVPTSNEFSVLATNSSGTYVSRTMSVNSILGSGQLEVIYDATSQGTMKWNLAFTPSTSGTYRLAYNWRGLPSSALADNPSRKLSLNHSGADYTLSWADVPDALNRTTSLSQGVFSLAVHLGMIHAGSTVRVDPSISTSTSQSATGNSYERHIFYEPTGGNYWAFYYDGGSMKARYSSDGVSWFDASSGGTLASTYNPWYDGPALYMAGQTVVVAQGEVKCCDFAQSPYTDTVHLYYGIGTISGTSIQWAGPYAADTETRTCDSQPSSTGYYYCTMTMGMKHVSATVGADGKIAFGWNWFWRYWPWLQLYLSCSRYGDGAGMHSL